jgi:hypothetical protein
LPEHRENWLFFVHKGSAIRAIAIGTLQKGTYPGVPRAIGAGQYPRIGSPRQKKEEQEGDSEKGLKGEETS